MKTTLCSAIYLTLIGAGALVAQPWFTQVTEGPIVNDALSDWYGYWGDYDNDGKLDVLVVGMVGQWRLYHNDGGTSFSTVTSGPMGDYSLRYLYGVWADPDNDGDLDLLTDSSGSAMYWNSGQGEFTRAPQAAGWMPGPSPLGGVYGAAWGDFDRDGFLDCLSTSTDHFTNALLHCNGDATFTWMSNSVLTLPADKIQVVSVVDYDNDGDLDLIPVRYGGRPTQFYQNDGHGEFTEATPEPIRSQLTYSLSAAWGDIDNDGDLDVIFGRWNGQSEHFYLNNGNRTFTPWAGEPALFESYDPQVGSWNAWGDFDNDGYLDLAGGGGTAPNWLWRNQGNGTFTEVVGESFVTDSGSFSQSGAWVDFNGDGSLDLFVLTLQNGKDRLFMGNGNGNHWLEVRPKGTVSNRLAVGARIFTTATIRGQVMRQMRVITASDSEQTLIAHIGLGDAMKVDTLRIEWPSGIVQELKDVARDQILTVTEPPRLIPQSAGGFRIQCWINQSFDIQASADLASWTTVATVTNMTGKLVFEDVETSQHECRYYRAVAE
jgi:hypothetical protein